MWYCIKYGIGADIDISNCIQIVKMTKAVSQIVDPLVNPAETRQCIPINRSPHLTCTSWDVPLLLAFKGCQSNETMIGQRWVCRHWKYWRCPWPPPVDNNHSWSVYVLLGTFGTKYATDIGISDCHYILKITKASFCWPKHWWRWPLGVHLGISTAHPSCLPSRGRYPHLPLTRSPITSTCRLTRPLHWRIHLPIRLSRATLLPFAPAWFSGAPQDQTETNTREVL